MTRGDSSQTATRSLEAKDTFSPFWAVVLVRIPRIFRYAKFIGIVPAGEPPDPLEIPGSHVNLADLAAGFTPLRAL
ncbi:MAG: hypothetical protein ACUVTH_11145 [Thermogutta sp.]